MSETTKTNSGSTGCSGALIYVVDDEPMLLELAKVILEPLGSQIECYRDPDLALQAFTAAQPRPDLLITDYAMHSLNGMELIERCRRLEPRQKILLVSGTVGEDIYRNTPTKPDEFLAKPYQAAELTGLVKALLKKK